MNDIWIIGTDPPCPRCALVTSRVKSILKETEIELTVKHLSYDNPEAKAYAASLGQNIGTAKDVAAASGIEMDFDSISQIITHQWMSATEQLGCSPENVPVEKRWSPELDVALQPFQEEAKRINFIMTPVLVINGIIKHQGSVPSENQIKEFVEQTITEQVTEEQTERI